MSSVVCGNSRFSNVVQVLGVRPARQLCSAVCRDRAWSKSFVSDVKVPSNKTLGVLFELGEVMQSSVKLWLSVGIKYRVAVDPDPKQVPVLERRDSLSEKTGSLSDVGHHSRTLSFPIVSAVPAFNWSVVREPRVRRSAHPWEGEWFLYTEDMNVLLACEFERGYMTG